jgi:hypothetical protein
MKLGLPKFLEKLRIRSYDRMPPPVHNLTYPVFQKAHFNMQWPFNNSLKEIGGLR